MKLSDFDVLSFDCYGTLIDWDSGIYAALRPLLLRAGAEPSPTGNHLSAAGMGLSRADVTLSRESVLQAFARLEAHQQEKTPDMVYPDLLAAVHAQLAIEWDVAPDSTEDAARISRHR
jgi:2-haloacid dehalogenase